MSERTNVLAVCALLMMVAIIPLGAATMTTSTTAAATISVGEEPTPEPDGTITAEPGETVTVSVWANASAVSGYQTKLTFNPNVVQVESVTGSDDFAAPVANVDNEDGSVDFNQIRDADGDDPVLAEITLTVVGEAGESATLSFDRADTETKFATDGGQTFVPQTYRNATVSVEEAQTVTETPAPTTEEPTTVTEQPTTTEEQTTTEQPPSTETPAPTTEEPTTVTEAPTTTEEQTTTTEEQTATEQPPSTETPAPTTEAPTTEQPTTAQPTTEAPTTEQPTTEEQTTTTEQPTTSTESSSHSNDDTDDDDDSRSGGSSGGGGYSAPAEPSLAIKSVTLDATNGSVGTAVTVSAVVENTGDADGEMNLRLGVDGDATGDERTVEVEAGETRTVDFSASFDAPGTYALAVNDVAAGTVTVAESASPEAATETSTAAVTATEAPTTETPAATTPSAEPTESATPTTTGGSTPGFGFLVTLVAMTLLVGWRALGRDER